MLFIPTPIAETFLIEPERKTDRRGFFARTWCAKEFQAQGLVARIALVNVSHNERKGTLRGMHYQERPHAETKIVGCKRGAIYDVVLDLRENSPSYRKWFGVELTDENQRSLYIPEGCAHGFQSLTDGAEVLYLMSEFYAPACARGVRYDDPAFRIQWPLPVTCISDADGNWPDYLATLPATAT
jgi:dTDP-4-dehydrorhamnose 3,5-epimerase